MNKLNLGSADTLTIPDFIAQGNGGVLEGTAPAAGDPTGRTGSPAP
ncbi:hypothetical protein [Streptomyces sp. NPDC055039]